MSEVKRYTPADPALEGCDVVKASDFEECVRLAFARGRKALESTPAREAALQQRLTAADERADLLEGLLREVVALDPRGEFLGWQLDGKIDAALKPADAHPCPVFLDGCDGGCNAQ